MALSVSGSSSLYWRTGLDNTKLKKDAMQTKGIIAGLMRSIGGMDIFAVMTFLAARRLTQLTRNVYKFSKNFEHAMKEVQTISEAVQENFQGISDQVMEMSKEFPINAEIMTRALYQIVSAGYDGAEAMELLRVSSELAVAGVTDTFVAADALTSVMNAYGESAGTAKEISAKLWMVVKLGKITMEELGQSIGTITGMAGALGLKFNELTGIIAESVKTLKAPIAMTGIRGILRGLVRPQDDAIALAKEYGIELSMAAVRGMGFVKFLQEMLEKTKDNRDVLAQLFPNIRGLTGILSLAADEGGRLSKAVGEMTDPVEEFNQAVKTMVEDTENQFNILHNNITAKLKPLGDALLDYAKSIAVGLNAMFSAMDENEVMRNFLSGGKISPKYAPEPSVLGNVNDVVMNQMMNTLLAKPPGVSQATWDKIIKDSPKKQAEIGDQMVEDFQDDLAEQVKAYQEAIRDKQRIADEARAEEERKAKEAADKAIGRPQLRMTPLAPGLSPVETSFLGGGWSKMKASYDDLYRDIRRMSDAELALYLKNLKVKQKAIKENYALEKAFSEQIDDITQEQFNREIEHLNDVADAFYSLGGILDMVDGKLAGIVRSTGDLLSEFGKLQSATSRAQEISAGFGMLKASADIFGPAIASIMGYGKKSRTYIKPSAPIDVGWTLTSGMISIANDMLSEHIKLLDEAYGPERLVEIQDTLGTLSGTIEMMKNTVAFITDVTQKAEAQEYLNELIILSGSLNRELREILTGTTEESIASAISAGFLDGLDSAQIFANTFEDIMKNALVGVFERQFITEFLGDWYKQLAESIGDEEGLTSAEATKLGDEFRDAIITYRNIFHDIFGDAGLPGLSGLFGEGDQDQDQGLTGAIKGITEETAGILSGQFNAVRMNTVEIITLTEDILEVNTRIADNTEYCFHLESIDNKLSALEGIDFESVVGGV